MFENTELNRINRLEVEKNELMKKIKSINPNSIIKNYVIAKREFKRKNNNYNLQQYLSELRKLAAKMGYDDENDIINRSNLSLLQELQEKFPVSEVDKLKFEYKKVSESLNKYRAQYAAMNPANGNKKRLFNDTKNILEYYSKKIPDISVIDKQIKVLELEMENYKKVGLKDKAQLCKESIYQLKHKRKNIKIKFTNGENQKNKKSPEEIDKLLSEDEVYVELLNKKKQFLKEIELNSPSKLVKIYKSAKENYLNVIGVLDSDEPSDVEQEFIEISKIISEKLNMTVADLTSYTYSQIQTMLNDVLDYQAHKERLDDVNLMINKRKSKVLDSYSTEDILFEIFDYSEDDTEGKIPKDVLVSTNMGKVQRMVASLCYKSNMMHNYDDALSGGLMGLTVAVNAWYDKQKPSDSALRFSDFFGLYVYNYAQRALYQITSGGSGSTAANYIHFRKVRKADMEKRVNEYIKANPEMADVKTELIENLLTQEEIDKNISKTLNPISETDYNAVIGGDDGDADMWNLSNYGKKNFTSEELLDGQKTYNKLLQSIHGLMNLFDVSDNNGTVKINKNRKLMDIYDRQIFLMKLGLDYKKTRSEVDNSDKPSTTEGYTWAEIADEIVRMKQNNGATNVKMSASAVLARWDRIIKKLKIAIEHNPKLKSGLEYMLNYIDNNKELIEKLSNDREEISIAMERQKLVDNYKSDPEIMDIEMLDGKRLGDDYDVSQDNVFNYRLNSFDQLSAFDF